MKINLSDYENLCKDKRQPIIVSQDRRSDCQHRAQNVVKQNNLRSVVRQYKKEVPAKSSTSDFKNYLKSSRRASTACLCMSGRTLQ